MNVFVRETRRWRLDKIEKILKLQRRVVKGGRQFDYKLGRRGEKAGNEKCKGMYGK
jgi:hypothetical protein